MSLIKKILEGQTPEAESDLENTLNQKKDELMGKAQNFLAKGFLSGKGLVGIGDLNGKLNMSNGDK